MPCSLDAGTYNLISARRVDGTVKHRKEVNCFLELPMENPFMFEILRDSKKKIKIIERDNVAYVIGQDALNLSYSMPHFPLRRPMKDGCLNPQERAAFELLKVSIHSLIGEVEKDKDIIYYTIPANALNQETDVDYHSSVLQSIFRAYKVNGKTVDARPINEALAIVLAELEDKMYTGVAISCLIPGTKVYTRRGIIPIEQVKVGDEVITHRGRWRPVTDVVTKSFSGLSTKLQLGGYSNNTDEYQFVDNHELYVKRDGKWVWLGCESLVEGDVVGEPIVYQEERNNARQHITLIERTTCSKEYKKNTYEVTGNLQRLVGYFLCDGSLLPVRNTLQFDFADHETDNIQDVKGILKHVFDKDCSEVRHGDNCTRVVCYSKGLVDWFDKNCYDAERKKKYPWCLSRQSKNDCVNLLAGLIRSDGCIGEGGVSFCNTNSSLVLLARQCFSRLGVPTSIFHRGPRSNSVLQDGRVINGKLEEWNLSSGSKTTLLGLAEIINGISVDNSINSEKLFIEDGYCCSKVQKIEHGEYTGTVYDLKVEEDHSFSGPFLTIHNCGSGMVNLCYSIFGQAIFQMALVNSGDWIDKMAGKACGESPTVINKEKTKVDLNAAPKSLVERAIKSQYEILIQKTVAAIKKGFIEAGTRANTEIPLEIVLAGGTASPPGFTELFEQAVKEAEWPLPVAKVRLAKDHLYTVANGALIAAEKAKS